MTKYFGNVEVKVEENWYEILNEFKVLECGKCKENTSPDYIYNRFLKEHTLCNKSLKRSFFENKNIYQLQAIKKGNNNTYTSQVYNNSLLFLYEEETEFEHRYDVLNYWRKKHEPVMGYTCDIFISKCRQISNCNNYGSNSKYKQLLLIGKNVPKRDEAEDIRNIVLLKCKKNEYKYCEPIIYSNIHYYMNGGNFLKCPVEVSQYPIPIHDYIENEKINHEIFIERKTDYELLYNQLMTLIQQQEKFDKNSKEFLDFEGLINYIEYQLDIAEQNGDFCYSSDIFVD